MKRSSWNQLIKMTGILTNLVKWWSKKKLKKRLRKK